MTEELQKLAKWAEVNDPVLGKFLIIIGENGIGKTWTVRAAGLQVFRWGDLVREYHEDPFRISMVNRSPFSSERIFCIDDLRGIRGPFGVTAHEAAYEVINTIYEASCLRCVITTNLSTAQFVDELGCRVASRLKSGFVIEMEGEDRRGDKTRDAGKVVKPVFKLHESIRAARKK